MGKSPQTLDGKALKNRENRLRLASARQGIRLVKLPRAGTYLLRVEGSEGACLGPPGCKLMVPQLSIGMAEQIIRDRQRQPAPVTQLDDYR